MFHPQRKIIYLVALSIVILHILALLLSKNATSTVVVEIMPKIKSVIATSTALVTATVMVEPTATVMPTTMPIIDIVVPPSIKHKNYKKALVVNGAGYSLTYSITNASIDKDNRLSFRVNTIKNTNVSVLSIYVMDTLKNSFDVVPITNGISKQQTYTAVITDANVKEICVLVYPLTEVLSKTPHLDLYNRPSAETNFDLDLLRRGY